MQQQEELTWKWHRKAYKAMKERERYAAKREQIRAYQNNFRKEHLEMCRTRHREYCRTWREKQGEKLRKYMRDYMRSPQQHLKNIDCKGRRRAREYGTKVEGRISWKTVWQTFNGNCGICHRPLLLGIHKFHFDHIIPLASGGLHTTSNLQIAHVNCNQRKHKKVSIP